MSAYQNLQNKGDSDNRNGYLLNISSKLQECRTAPIHTWAVATAATFHPLFRRLQCRGDNLKPFREVPVLARRHFLSKLSTPTQTTNHARVPNVVAVGAAIMWHRSNVGGVFGATTTAPSPTVDVVKIPCVCAIENLATES